MACESGNKRRVLIVDPSRTMRRLIREEFSTDRYEVFEAAKGAEAIRCAADNAPDVVTLGTVLADGDSVEVHHALAELLHDTDSPIVVVTSENAEQERLKAFRYGVVHFIQKGFKSGELAAYVDEILRPQQSLHGTRILIVDDCPLPRACLRKSLGARGAQVVEADDGDSALQLVSTQHFDLVITDHFMTNVTGLEFMRTVRRTTPPDELPIILLSAATSHSVLAEALASGANDFIHKPFEAVELLARVNNCLRTSALAHQLRAATREAENANRAKSAFFANMSHEIRTPMTAVLGYAEQLKDNSLTPLERDTAVDSICQSGVHLLGLINEILDFSKIEAGHMSIEQIDLNPVDILLDVQASTQPIAADKGLRMIVSVDGEIPQRIRSDPVRLRQILINLVSNAIKFTKTGEVRVTMQYVPADSSGGQPKSSIMKYSVADTGIGIDPDCLHRIFDAFSQADGSTTRRFGGTGLGLAISRHCARLLGGNIVVTSEPGVGSTFTATVATGDLVDVPFVKPSLETERQRRMEKARAYAENEQPVCLHGRVLIADDGVFNQKLLRRILVKAGLIVTLVDDGRSAVETAMKSQSNGDPFRVILMDMQMPVLDGVGATRELRERGFAEPIVALTANTSAEDRERCLEAGCDDFLTKPIDKRQLLEVIGRYCQPATPVTFDV